MTYNYPEAVAVDTYDGYVFHNDATGHLFTAATARAFVDKRNAEQPAGHKTYAVFTLTQGTPASSPGARLLSAPQPLAAFPRAPQITEPYGYRKAA